MEKEIWYPINGYEGLYEVSSFGNVRSLNWERTRQIKNLRPAPTPSGYLTVILCKNGKRKCFTVHRLVAEAFLPNWFGDQQVNHIDEDKTNNIVDNLEWCDCKYNNNYGTHIKRISEKNTNGKKSKSVIQYTKTGEFVKEWPSTNECGRNGYSQQCVSKCCSGKRKTHKGYIWKYK